MHHLGLVSILVERRKSLKVTQEMLSELSGVGLRTIKQLEGGKGNPTLNTILSLSDVLGLEMYLRPKKMPHNL